MKYGTLVLLGAGLLFGQSRPGRYIVILEDPPAAEAALPGKNSRAAAVEDRRRRIEAAQQGLKAALAARGVETIGATQTLLNAVFVRATQAEATGLKGLPGVRHVERLRRLRRHLGKALDLVNAP
ncbi:MAG: hypothetical protein ACRD7E_23500, partial [Bryobacteraceae bacterium]